jgi:pseudouridine kinase
LLEHAERCGIETQLVLRDPARVTPEYAAVVTAAGELIVGLADMSAVETIGIPDLESRWEHISQAEWIFADCNLSADVLRWIIGRANRDGVRLAIDAVSEPKVCKVPDDLNGLDLFVLNEREAAVYLYEDGDAFAALPMAERAGRVRARGARNVVMTMGERGVVTACEDQVQHIRAVAGHTVDTTGGGDALCAGVIYGLVRERTLHEGARIGSLAAALTVESPATVRPDLSLSLLDLHAKRLDEAWTLL